MMTNKELMFKFISYIYNKGLITKFLINIFNYQNFSEINYIFRVSLEDNYVIMDVFDNISANRFNRYFFDFGRNKYKFKVEELSNVFLSRINISNLKNNNTNQNNLLKLAYLFKLSHSRMINYAKKFLDEEFVTILRDIISDIT